MKIPDLSENIFRHQRWVLGFAWTAAVLLVASLFNRFAHIDDAWLGEYAWFLSKNGYVRSELLRGYYDHESRVLVYHKAWVLLGAAVIRIAGFGLFQLKMLSLLSLGGLLWLVRYYLKKIPGSSPLAWPLFMGMLLIHPLVVEYAFVYRPEMCLALLGFGTWVLLERHLKSSNTGWAVLAGLLSGLAVAVHLHGAIFVMAGACLLAMKRRVGSLAIFLFTAAAVAIPIYFWDIRSASDYRLWLAQFQLGTGVSSASMGWRPLFQSLLHEQMRWLHSPKEAACTLFILAVASRYFPFWRKSYPDLLAFTLFTIFWLAVIGCAKTSMYTILYLPLILLLVFLALSSQEVSIGKFKWFIYLTYCLFVLVSGVYYVKLVAQNGRIVKKNQVLATHLPPGAKVLAPMTFIFNEIEEFRIQGLFTYGILNERRLYPETRLFDLAAKFENEFILLDDRSYQQWVRDSAVTDCSPYSVIHTEPGWTIFELQTRK